MKKHVELQHNKDEHEYGTTISVCSQIVREKTSCK